MADKKTAFWGGHPLLNAKDAEQLELAAAVHEFHHGKDRVSAEKAALDEYRRDSHAKAAAHHLMGMRAGQATGSQEDAKKHYDMYALHLKALGHEASGPVPPEVKRLTEGENVDRAYSFKGHGADQFLVNTVKKAEVPQAVYGYFESLTKADRFQLLDLDGQEGKPDEVLRQEQAAQSTPSAPGPRRPLAMNTPEGTPPPGWTPNPGDREWFAQQRAALQLSPEQQAAAATRAAARQRLLSALTSSQHDKDVAAYPKVAKSEPALKLMSLLKGDLVKFPQGRVQPKSSTPPKPSHPGLEPYNHADECKDDSCPGCGPGLPAQVETLDSARYHKQAGDKARARTELETKQRAHAKDGAQSFRSDLIQKMNAGNITQDEVQALDAGDVWDYLQRIGLPRPTETAFNPYYIHRTVQRMREGLPGAHDELVTHYKSHGGKEMRNFSLASIPAHLRMRPV